MIAIIDYGVGNLLSIRNMLKQAGYASLITSEQNDISNATKIIMPGMGHFDNCMNRFNNSGLRSIIEKRIFEDKIPLLGICVGLQMFMQDSQEGSSKGLNWIKGHTVRFDFANDQSSLKIPNLGWSEIQITKDSPIISNLENSRFYFAHSYHVVLQNESDELASCVYGYKFACAIALDNIYGVQFHPEKSHRFGMQLLKNFAAL